MQHEAYNEECLERHVEIVDEDLFTDVVVLDALCEVIQSAQDAFNAEESEESETQPEF